MVYQNIKFDMWHMTYQQLSNTCILVVLSTVILSQRILSCRILLMARYCIDEKIDQSESAVNDSIVVYHHLITDLFVICVL